MMVPMKAPVQTALAAAIVLGAAAMALLRPWATADGSQQAAPTPTVAAAAPDEPFGATTNGLPPSESLPAGHPPISGMRSPLPTNHPPIGETALPPVPIGTAAEGPADEAPTLTWSVPAGWKALPNPNAMRIATYRPKAGSELLVVRAGGSTDANIRRWIDQFDEQARSRRSRKTVHGLEVEILQVSGTYAGGNMMQSAPSEPHPGWSLLAAVVESAGAHYFFKLVGPTEEVEAARSSFDALIDSIRPL